MHAGQQLVHHLHRAAHAGRIAQPPDLGRDRVEHRLARAKAASGPDAMTVMLPPCAATAPPETGASSISNPASASFVYQRSRRTPVPRWCSTAPPAPVGNLPTQPCGAEKHVVRSAPRSPRTRQRLQVLRQRGRPVQPRCRPLPRTSSRAASRGSQPCTAWPLRARFSAAPIPIEPEADHTDFHLLSLPLAGTLCGTVRPQPPAPADPRLQRRMPGIRASRSAVPPAMPRPVRTPCVRADHVVAPLHDFGRDMRDAVHAAQQAASAAGTDRG